MANARVSKADRLLNRLAQAPTCSLTPEGVCFLRQRFDPYHDLPMKPVGLPDDYNGATVSRCIKRTVTISQTSGGAPATTTPWDCHIFNTPISEGVQEFLATAPNIGNTFTFDPSGMLCDYGGLMIVGNNASGTPFGYPIQGGTIQTLLGTLSLNPEDLSNNMRLVAQGFEIIDGTANLYQQGILTAYRQNQPVEGNFYAQGLANPPLAATSMIEFRGTACVVKTPPQTTGAALLIPGSKQWLVKEGAYVSVDFHANPKMCLPPMVSPFLAYDNEPNSPDLAAQFRWMNWTGNFLTTNIPGTSPLTQHRTIAVTPTRIQPINQHGIFLTGLHPLATITVNCIWYVECAPDGDDEQLLTLASPSPSLDNFALMLVSELRRDSPVAVKLRENYMGEWFVNGVKDVINTVTPWLSNAQTIGRQVVDWADQASKNNGMLNPQSFVRGSVSDKVEKDLKHKKASNIPKAPGPAPAMRAYKPKPVEVVVARRTNEPQSKKKVRRVRKFDDTAENRRTRNRAIERNAARGVYDATPRPPAYRSRRG